VSTLSRRAPKRADSQAPSENPGAASDEARRRGLLDAALGVFARYGFRKTSMDEVARAAQLSRQGLYLHFATKEELFRATLLYVLSDSLSAAEIALADGSLPLETRLVRGFDAWVGRFVGLLGAGASDLIETSTALVGPAIAEHDERFLAAVARTVRGSPLLAAYKRSGLTARQLAEISFATARGLKHQCDSREAFVRGMTLAVRALCAPLEAGEGRS
jgi:AcrR family transcriptional regulator